ncbi:MAG: acylphosphatase [Cyanobacteriota bacterium]|nr:acylphosphatase [Cyanobacteriota bacterium]
MTDRSSDGSRPRRARPLGWMPGDSLVAPIANRRFTVQRQPTGGEGRPAGPPQRWQILVSGRVQGVGYRNACQRRATDLGLGGWVRNRSDGQVEVEAEGPPERLEELRLWCERGPAMAGVRSVSVSPLPACGVDWFEIRR